MVNLRIWCKSSSVTEGREMIAGNCTHKPGGGLREKMVGKAPGAQIVAKHRYSNVARLPGRGAKSRQWCGCLTFFGLLELRTCLVTKKCAALTLNYTRAKQCKDGVEALYLRGTCWKKWVRQHWRQGSWVRHAQFGPNTDAASGHSFGECGKTWPLYLW